MSRANCFLVTFGLALLPFAAQAECVPELDAGSANQAATAASAAPTEDCLTKPAAPADPAPSADQAPSAAQAPTEAPTQLVVPAASDPAPLIQEVVAAPTGVDPAAGYQKKTEFDNTPYRFNAEKGFTAAEFDAWMASRGIRIATGKPTSTAAAGIALVSDPAIYATVPTAASVGTPSVVATQLIAPLVPALEAAQALAPALAPAPVAAPTPTAALAPVAAPAPAPTPASAPAPAPAFQSAPVATSSAGCSVVGQAAAC